MHQVLVLLKKGNRGSYGYSSYMCCTEMISCQQIQVQGYLRNHKGDTVNKIQPCEFIEQPAPPVDTGENACIIHIRAIRGQLTLSIPEGIDCVGICPAYLIPVNIPQGMIWLGLRP